MSAARDVIRVSEWLETRAPRPPAELSRRLQEIVGDAEAAESDLPSLMIEKAIIILEDVGDDRAAASDLLAADALITYAMEAAAETHADPGEFARECAARIAGVAGA